MLFGTFKHRETRRCGAAVIYMVVAIIPILGCGSLAVDFGHVLLVRTQLQGAVDAAARAAAAQLLAGASSTTAQSKAISSAAANTVDSTPLVLTTADIVIGNYASNTFTAGGSPSNAVKVTGYRTRARSTAVNLTLATVVGRSTFDLTATAMVMEIPADPKYGVVALTGANINNAFTEDSYNSSVGSYATNINQNATLANGGSWNFSTTATIKGNLYYTGSSPTGGIVTGSRLVLPSTPTLASQYPLIATPGGTTSGGNYNGGNLTLTSGNYSYTSFTLNSGDTLTVSGKVNIYVSGNINLNGVVNNNGLPANLTIYNTVAAGVNISNGPVYAVIYAPASPINLNGSAQVYGEMIGSTFSSSGGGQVHVDEALVGSSSGSKITTVQ